MLPFTLISALECRRLPLTSTSTWSGASPRRVAGRVWSVPSATVGRGKLKEGASDWMICAVSVRPGLLDLGRGEHVHRDRRIGGGALGGPGPDDRQLLQRQGLAGEAEVAGQRLAGRDLDRVAGDAVADVADPDLVPAGRELQAVGAVLPRGGRLGDAEDEHPRAGERLAGFPVEHPAGQGARPGPGRSGRREQPRRRGLSARGQEALRGVSA